MRVVGEGMCQEPGCSSEIDFKIKSQSAANCAGLENASVFQSFNIQIIYIERERQREREPYSLSLVFEVITSTNSTGQAVCLILIFLLDQ